MTDDNPTIETTLAQINDHYADYEPLERVGEAVIERDARRVEYVYDISTEDEQAKLQVHARYYLNGKLKNESNATQTYPTDGGRVYHTESGQELYEFIEANAFADAQVTLTDEFESMVETDN